MLKQPQCIYSSVDVFLIFYLFFPMLWVCKNSVFVGGERGSYLAWQIAMCSWLVALMSSCCLCLVGDLGGLVLGVVAFVSLFVLMQWLCFFVKLGAFEGLSCCSALLLSLFSPQGTEETRWLIFRFLC